MPHSVARAFVRRCLWQVLTATGSVDTTQKRSTHETSNTSFNRTISKHLYAIAFNICRNQQDAEDVVQDTFIQYHTYKKEFDTEEHIRAWLIRVAINKAKNITRSFWHRNKCNLEEYIETLTFETPESETLFDTVMKLPEKYRIVLHLFYYEDYTTQEISDILHLSVSNVKTRLSRGRALLKETLKEEWNDDE